MKLRDFLRNFFLEQFNVVHQCSLNLCYHGNLSMFLADLSVFLLALVVYSSVGQPRNPRWLPFGNHDQTFI